MEVEETVRGISIEAMIVALPLGVVHIVLKS